MDTINKDNKYRYYFPAIFKCVEDGLILLDNNLRVLEYSDGIRHICGIPYFDCKGSELNALQKKCSGKCVNIITECLKTKKAINIQHLECRHSARKNLVVSVSTQPVIDKEGDLTGCVIAIKDKTFCLVFENSQQDFKKYHNIIGESTKMKSIYSLINDLSSINTTVLILGESGTGKELIAEAIHKHKKSDKPLVKVNCAAIPDNLLESELFGHVKGSFTGAHRDRIGRFQKADGGTIFLDEIGDISNKMQLRLLRVLENREFERVGDSNTTRVNLRVIAATNQDLFEKVKQGKFREDLLYRLSVMEIVMPSLREKSEDIPVLTNYFLDKFIRKYEKKIKHLSFDVKKAFIGYDWPGNVRELKHVIEYVVIRSNGPIITMDNLPPRIQKHCQISTKYQDEKITNEPDNIKQALEKSGWNKSKAARLLNMDRKTIYRKIKKYDIQ